MESSDDVGVVRRVQDDEVALLDQQVVPLHLGVTHQAGAVIVFGIAVWHAHRLLRRA